MIAAEALLAIAFAFVPLRNAPGKRKWLLIGAVALFVLGIGGGAYLLVGRPHLAERAAMGMKMREANGLVPYLISEVRKDPKNVKAWRYLAQLYMGANDPGDAARALAHVLQLTGRGDPV